MVASPAIENKIDKWKERLIGFREDNPLVRLPDGKGKNLKFKASASQVFQAITKEDARLEIKTLETEPADPESLGILKNFRKKSNQVMREKGVNCLFIAIGTISWSAKDKPNSGFKSPILLIPVELIMPRKEEYILQMIDEEIVLNSVLSQKIRADYGIDLPDFPGTSLKCDDYLKQIKQIFTKFPQWKFNLAAYLAVFDRPKVAMVNDLERNIDKIKHHPILQGLSGDSSNYQPENNPSCSADNLDKRHPRSLYEVIDADSTQQVVIEAAKSGLSFIVQGPPGTGKSQTITNIISELIAQRKKVLVVAEKPSALDVVAKRLDRCGLSDLYLPMYEQKTNQKKAFIQSIQSTIDELQRFSPEDDSNSFFEDLKISRDNLNAYPELLHKIWRPIEKSAFDLYGDLLNLEREGIPSLDSTIRNIQNWSTDHLRSVRDELERLEGLDSIFRGQETTLWIKSRYTSNLLDDRNRLEGEIYSFCQNINKIQEVIRKISTSLHILQPNSQEEVPAFVNIIFYIINRPAVLPLNWQTSVTENLYASLADLEDKYRIHCELSESIQIRYNLSTLFAINIHEALSKIRNGHKNILRIFKKEYRDIHKSVFSHRHRKSGFSYIFSLLFGYRQLLNDAKKLSECHILHESIYGLKSHHFMPFLNGDTFDFSAIKEALGWIAELKIHSLSQELVGEIVESKERSIEFVDLHGQVKDAQSSIEDGFQFLRQAFSNIGSVITGSNQSLEEISFTEIKEFVEKADSELNLFGDWSRCQQHILNLNDLGAKSFIEALKISSIDSSLWYPTLLKVVYQRWLECIYEQHPILKDFNSNLHERRVKEFTNNDKEQYLITPQRLRAKHIDYWNAWVQLPDSKKKISIIKEEKQKLRSKKSIREIIHETGDLIPVLKPCWMMSPLNVSEYIDSQTQQFDVVIFDEASQIRTEDVIPSIMRAKQVIVVGDEKQLPPTFSFVKFDDDEEDDESDDNYESFLTECGKFMKNFTLLYHYRSKDESLIAFSNEHFYSSKLITFPSPSRNTDRGVHFHYVENGIYDRGNRKPVNVPEAREVANLVLQHIQTSSQSLGVIAFSKNQAEAIQKEIDRISVDCPNLAELQEDPTKFFLRHLESVQGEEADVIILSFCYGKDKNGNMTQNFGKLNRDEGERRLNVAITRARQKVILVASIHAGDIVVEGKKDSLKKLRSYLSYAESRGNEKAQTTNVVESQKNDVIEDIHRELLKAEYSVEKSIGCSEFRIDLAVINETRPNEFLLGIEVDGKMYHKHSTARDRDRLRRKILEEDLKWDIHRIWSKEWFHDRENQLSRLIEVIENLKNKSDSV